MKTVLLILILTFAASANTITFGTDIPGSIITQIGPLLDFSVDIPGTPVSGYITVVSYFPFEVFVNGQLEGLFPWNGGVDCIPEGMTVCDNQGDALALSGLVSGWNDIGVLDLVKSSDMGLITFTVTTKTPEPSTLVLVGIGIVLLLFGRKRGGAHR